MAKIAASNIALFRHIIDCHEKGVLAVSGGSDSMALLAIFETLVAKEYRKSWHVITVDHGLRAFSRQEAELVKTLALSMGFSAHILEAQQITKSNKSASSRFARYKAIAAYAQINSLSVCITAHHKQDQIETLMMRLFRGSGLDGLLGMGYDNAMFGMTIIRPCLSFSKQELHDIALESKLPIFEDQSNKDLSYDRIKIRETINQLEQHNLDTSKAVRTMNYLRSDADYIHGQVEEWWQENALIFNRDYIKLNRISFNNLHIALKSRILSKALCLLNYGDYPPSLSRLHSLVEEDFALDQKRTLHKSIIYTEKDSLIVAPEAGRRSYQTIEMSLSQKNDLVWDKRYYVKLCQSSTLASYNLFLIHLADYGMKKLICDIKSNDSKGFNASFYINRLYQIPNVARPCLMVIHANLPNGEKMLIVPSIGLDTHQIQPYLICEAIYK